MTSPPAPGHPPIRHQPGLAATVALYALARIAMVAVVAAVLLLAGAPFFVAVLVGLVVALPLSMVAFRGLRARLDLAIAETRQRRSAERSALRERLRGDDPAAGSDHRPQHEPDGREG